MSFKFIAGHVDVSGERLVAYGDVLDNPDQRLIDQGYVIPLEESKAPVVTATYTKETVADAAGN